MEAIEYLEYKIGSLCSHSSTHSSIASVDLICKQKENRVHKVSQIGKICNKCASLIAKSASQFNYCLCCSQSLQQYLKDHWICVHSDRTYDEVTIKCLDDHEIIHEVPFKSRVCQRCYNKIRAAFMFANKCQVCQQKQNQTFQNLEKTLTMPAYYYFEHVIKNIKNKKIDDKTVKEQIQSYCLAEPNIQAKNLFEEQIDTFGENLTTYHQSKRYQLYPKCQKHRDLPLNLCNSCLVSILNLHSCPYGCESEKLNKNDKKKVKAEPPKISETGFVSLYPKTFNNYQYLQFFVFRQIQEIGRLDRWEGLIRKIRLSGKNEQKVSDRFSLYASVTQVSNDKFLYTGGASGAKITDLSTVSVAFWIKFSTDRKQFELENVTNFVQKRSSHGSVFLDGYVYIIGGFIREKSLCLSSCQRFDIQNNKWSSIPSLKIERSKPTVFSHKGFIYVVGGLSTNQELTENYCERYHPEKNTWQSLPYDGYDVPYLNGMTTLNSAWGLPQADNLITVGGSNYDSMTYLVQTLDIKKDCFSMNQSGIPEKLQYGRIFPAVSLMKTSKTDDYIAIVFGGLEEHESFLTLDAVRVKIDKKENKNQLVPFFTYDNIQIGSYRLLLRQNASKSYEFMMKKLESQQILDSEKYDKQKQQTVKSQFNTHMIQKMWYGIGKCMIGLNI